MKMLLPFLYYCKILLTPTVSIEQSPSYKKVDIRIHKYSTLDSVVTESSGLCKVNDSTYGTINDSGGSPCIYLVDSLGGLKKTIEVPKAKNKDWEEVQWVDATATWWVGDIGNNANKRKNLCFYEYTGDSMTKRHPFRYEDQFDFPPTELNFDAEAFYYKSDTLYILSKNRTKQDEKLYSLPIGDSIARVQQRMSIQGMVTAASLRKSEHNRERLLVLTYGWIYIFDLQESDSQIRWTPIVVRKFCRGGQNEAICWVDASTFLITNEKGVIFKATIRGLNE